MKKLTKEQIETEIEVTKVAWEEKYRAKFLAKHNLAKLIKKL